MRELYVILGRIGWVWFGVFWVLLALGLSMQRVYRRRRQQRGFEVIASDEKQS
jgi:hypothetical protein